MGWKDTVRVSPLEDTIVALRPIIPTLPFEIPNSIRPLDPMMPLGENIGAATLIVDPDGNVSTIKNALVNFGWEYVYHCHILSHEEMDMMRPVLMALPPFAGRWSDTGDHQPSKRDLVERQLDHRDVVHPPEVGRRHDLDGRCDERVATRPAEHQG